MTYIMLLNVVMMVNCSSLCFDEGKTPGPMTDKADKGTQTSVSYFSGVAISSYLDECMCANVTVRAVNSSGSTAFLSEELCEYIVAKYPTMCCLTVSDVYIENEALRHFAALKELEVVALAQSNLTDAGLSHICKCRSLRSLVLNRTQITDRSIPRLAAAQNVRVIEVLNCTYLSHVAIKSLRKELPDAMIFASYEDFKNKKTEK